MKDYLQDDPRQPAFANLPEQVARRMADAVISGELLPGEHLREQEFSDRFGVSRGTVREAIRILERDGVATIIPRRGAIVTTLSADEVREIYEVREVLFGQAAALCAERRADDLNRGLSGLVEAMEQADGEGDVAKYATLSNQLALAIIEGGGNRRLRELFSRMSLQIARYTHLGLARPERRQESLANWRHLIQGIAMRDGDTAENWARTQIRRVKEEVMPQL